MPDTVSFVSAFLARAIENTGRTPIFFGVPLTPDEVCAPDGGLPLFLQAAQQRIYLLQINSHPEWQPKTDWLAGLNIKPSESPGDSMLGIEVVGCSEVPGVPGDQPRSPLAAVLFDVLQETIRLTPELEKIDLSVLLTPQIHAEVFNELSIERWSQIRTSERGGIPSPAV